MKPISLIILAVTVYAAAIAETSLAPAIEVRHVTPDLFALAAILWQLTAGRGRGFVIAALVGLAYDLTAAGPLGVGMGMFALVGYGIAQIRSHLDLEHLPLQLAMILAATMAIALGEAGAWRLLGETTLPWSTLVVRAMSVGVYTTAIALPILLFCSWFHRTQPAAA
jgi:rod shape-determining protein MreD